MYFPETGGRCGKFTAQVRLDPAVGAQWVAGAAQGTPGCSGDGGGPQSVIWTFNTMAGGGGSHEVSEVGQLCVGAGSRAPAEVAQHVVHWSGVGDEVAGWSPEGLVERFGAYWIRRQPAPKEVDQRCQAGQGAGGRVAPANHAPSADVCQALQGFDRDEKGPVGRGRGENICICDGSRSLDEKVVNAGRLGDTPRAGEVGGGVGWEGRAKAEHASVAAACCCQGMTGTGP